LRKIVAIVVPLVLLAAILMHTFSGRDTAQDTSRFMEKLGPPVTGGARHKEKPPGSPEPAEPGRSPEAGHDEDVGGRTPERDGLVGDFCFPKDVPYFRVSSSKEAGNDLARVLEMVVGTRASSEVDLTRISRTLKAFHADRDALVISFKDLSARDERAVGEAYVTNTTVGALILGMSDGPPNREGLLVASYADGPTRPQDEVFAASGCSRTRP
jgi:hypothetical protein